MKLTCYLVGLGVGASTVKSVSAVGTYFCGSTWTAASTSCSIECPNGVDDDCPAGQHCWQDVTTCESVQSNRYCGSSWTDAGKACVTECPLGTNAECPAGSACYSGTTCATTFANRYCGSTWADAASKCQTACPDNNSSACPSGQSCFSLTNCSNKRANRFCGPNWATAAQTCSAPCPDQSNDECPVGEFCYNDTTCQGKTPKVIPVVVPAPAPTPSTPTTPVVPPSTPTTPVTTPTTPVTTPTTPVVTPPSTPTTPVTPVVTPPVSLPYGEPPAPTKTAEPATSSTKICRTDKTSESYKTEAVDYCDALFDPTVCTHDATANTDACYAVSDGTHAAASKSLGQVYLECKAKCMVTALCECVHQVIGDATSRTGDEVMCSGDRYFDDNCFSQREESTCGAIPGCEWVDAVTDATAFCGASMAEANSECSIPCPNGLEAECPEGQACFTGSSCGGVSASGGPAPTPVLSGLPATAETASADVKNAGGSLMHNSDSAQRAVWFTVMCICGAALLL